MFDLKKMKFILIFLFFIFFFDNVYAESYKCVYNYKKSDDSYKVTIDIDSNNKTTNIVIDQTDCTLCWKYQSAQIIDFSLTDNEEISQQTLNNIYSGKCDSTLMVFRYWSDGKQQHYFQMLFNDTLEAEAIDYMQTGFGGGTYIDLTYGWLDFSADESTAPASDIVYKCDKYDELYEQLDNTYKNIQSCKGNCSSYYSQYSSLKD